MQKKFKIAVLCGGPSLERGISLNSARSVLDHLEDDSVEVVPFYFDHLKRPYKISKAQLYSNTPSDFDFKLKQMAQPLSETQLVKALRQVDLAFPAMHGAWGEDGGLQSFLEKHDIPFVGSGSKASALAFDKHKANLFIQAQGFYAAPSAVLKIYGRDHAKILHKFFAEHKITRAIVKPASGGSSIGVFSVSNPAEALEKSKLIFSKRYDTRVVVEPFIKGTEFTTIILQSRFGLPVAVLPTEIETDYREHQIFDFRKKYLPTRQVTYHCPPRFDNETIEKIQVQAEQLFKILEMRDFARFDGWVLPNGQLWFADFNPISGMEQNSFLFQQASRVGMSHRDVLRYVVKTACRRYGLEFPDAPTVATKSRKPLAVIFGGNTSERQVSLMSGTNVWLKLRKSKLYDPSPFLLDGNIVWQLPYAFTLNHTVEEIIENCRNAVDAEKRLNFLEQKVRLRLALNDHEATQPLSLPKKYKLEEFVRHNPFVFIALHGGAGEDGRLQKIFDRHRVRYNGSGPAASQLAMDKWATAELIRQLNRPGITSVPGALVQFKNLRGRTEPQYAVIWNKLKKELRATTLIVKPRRDGCSSGIVHLHSAAELARYIKFYEQRATCIPKNTFLGQRDIVDLPLDPIAEFIFEKFVETDSIKVKGNSLKYRRNTGWIEITVGLVEENKSMHALNPSITIAESGVLSVEEKFQGGTGINITPPPASIIKPAALNKAKRLVEQLAKDMNLRGYSRVDAFIQVSTGNLCIIEVNNLPGLTPSTVFYHQGLAEAQPIFPVTLLEKFVGAAGY